MSNHLLNQTSPYLLQHAQNPVNWYPWCEEAFSRAKKEDKPIFLSIGYSTCHWCHVMAHESFEDEEIAEILNQYFISIKVDKEERPDIDHIYMAVCQAFTGSGGWPTTVFLTPDQRPFFAGTYFPKTAAFGRMGLKELLFLVQDKWVTKRDALLAQANEFLDYVKEQDNITKTGKLEEHILPKAFLLYQHMFDAKHGGFGQAPKFPTPHNLLFLLNYYERNKNEEALHMAEKTLIQMYRGGMFDHIGGGFSRYSTDEYFLVPHFEKMLYDNALLIFVYCKAWQLTGKPIYRLIAEKCADFILQEMTAEKGGFYSAQDADSEGEEGKYYVFTPSEIIEVLGEEKGNAFNSYYDIIEGGNFEGKSIPNLLKNEFFHETEEKKSVSGSLCNQWKDELQKLYDYRKNRYSLHMDDKILTSWNSLMIAAMCQLYRISKKTVYLDAAQNAQSFIFTHLYKEDTLFISYREGKRSEKGLLDDYAFQTFALISLYEATLNKEYLNKAQEFCKKVLSGFYDEKNGGFFLSGDDNERLILRPKETYDGAIFSGNSAMTYNLVRLSQLTYKEEWERAAKDQLDFMCSAAQRYPAGYSMLLVALLDYLMPPAEVTIVPDKDEIPADLSCNIPLGTIIHVLDKSTKEYPLKDNKTTYYICQNKTCKPPVNVLDETVWKI